MSEVYNHSNFHHTNVTMRFIWDIVVSWAGGSPLSLDRLSGTIPILKWMRTRVVALWRNGSHDIPVKGPEKFIAIVFPSSPAFLDGNFMKISIHHPGRCPVQPNSSPTSISFFAFHGWHWTLDFKSQDIKTIIFKKDGHISSRPKWKKNILLISIPNKL